MRGDCRGDERLRHARPANSAQGAATAAAQALANAQTVASAAEQLTASIREIGAQVSQSTAVVGRAVAAGSETRDDDRGAERRRWHASARSPT